MRVLITGAAGFVGQHACEALLAAGATPLLTDARPQPPETGIERLNICDAAAVSAAVARLQPDACLHLAGVAFVTDAESHPRALNAINVDGPLNVARALLQHAPAARLLFVSSAQVYGYRYCDEPLREDAELRPASPYACSKAEAEAALLELAASEGLDVVIGRPGNHTGPGQVPKFVVPAFIQALCRFRTGASEDVAVGKLESERDFTDVRDVVAAYLLLLRTGKRSTAYNISAGLHLRIGELLFLIATLAGVVPKLRVDPALYLPPMRCHA